MLAQQRTEEVERLQAESKRLGQQLDQRARDVVFRDRTRRQRPHLYGCLSEPAAEPTNNQAKRALRPAVIGGKISWGNRTLAGEFAWEWLRSIATTACLEKKDPVEAIVALLRFLNSN